MARAANKTIADYPSQVLGYLKNLELFSNVSDRELSCFQDVVQIRSYKKDKIE